MGKFLKKLWCCVGGEYYKIISVYQVDNVNWPPLRDSKADVSSVSPSSEQLKLVCCLRLAFNFFKKRANIKCKLGGASSFLAMFSRKSKRFRFLLE